MRNIKIYKGIKLENLSRIDAISWYNHNYYVGLKRKGQCANDLLYVESDDDNTSEIYLITGDSSIHIGYCYTSEENRIRLDGED